MLRRICDTRVWSILRRVAPSKHLSPDFHRSKPGALPYPLWLPPDAKLSVAGVLALMRDHYEGTEYDMTQGIDAGPSACPAGGGRCSGSRRPDYVWERPISTQQTAFSFVAQLRSWMPDPVGGLYWYGVDDTFTSCFVPFTICIDALPKSYVRGSNSKFTFDSAWWTFNLVTNYAYLKWSMMVPEIQACQKDLETNFLALQPAVEKTALELYKTSPNLATRYLTDYSVMHAEQTVARWRRTGWAPDRQIQRRLRPRRDRDVSGGRLSRGLAPPRDQGAAGKVQAAGGEGGEEVAAGPLALRERAGTNAQPLVDESGRSARSVHSTDYPVPYSGTGH